MDILALPTIFDWLNRLEPFRGQPTLLAIALTGLIILVFRDWRLMLLALLGHYLLAGLLFADVLLPHLAFIKVITGLFICLVMYITARQTRSRPPLIAAQAPASHKLQLGALHVANNRRWRLTAGLLLTLFAVTLGQMPAFFLPGMVGESAPVNGAIYFLFILGMLHMTLTSDVWQSGMGFLLALTGFELFYNNLTHSPGVLIALTAVSLGSSLVISWVAQIQERRAEFTA